MSIGIVGKRLLVTSALLMAMNVQASETNLILHSISKHIGTDRDYNEYNPAVGLELIDGKHGFTVGTYIDSYKTRARYIGGLYLPYKRKYVNMGLMYGVITSPSYVGGKIIPMVLPYMKVKVTEYAGINTMLLPKFQSNGAWVVGVQFYINLD